MITLPVWIQWQPFHVSHGNCSALFRTSAAASVAQQHLEQLKPCLHPTHNIHHQKALNRKQTWYWCRIAPLYILYILYNANPNPKPNPNANWVRCDCAPVPANLIGWQLSSRFRSRSRRCPQLISSNQTNIPMKQRTGNPWPLGSALQGSLCFTRFTMVWLQNLQLQCP